MLLNLIFFYLAVKINFVNSGSSSCDRTTATTELQRFNNHVLRRRIRSLVFPNKAQLLLTPAFTKAIIDGRPRGLAYSVEFDMYNPLPDTIEGWRPTILVNKLKDNIIASDPLKTNSLDLKNVVQNHNEIFNNYTKETNHRSYALYDHYNFPFHKNEETNDLNLEWTTNKMSFSNRNFKKDSNKLYGFASNFHNLPYSRKIYKRSINANKKFSKRNSSIAKLLSHGLQSERERKQLHKQLEIVGKIFKFNMKNCIQRAICEINSQFRKHGESVMEDIIRLILIPSYHPKMSIGRDSILNISCKERFAVSCPYNLLNIFTKNINAN